MQTDFELPSREAGEIIQFCTRRKTGLGGRAPGIYCPWHWGNMLFSCCITVSFIIRTECQPVMSARVDDPRVRVAPVPHASLPRGMFK